MTPARKKVDLKRKAYLFTRWVIFTNNGYYHNGNVEMQEEKKVGTDSSNSVYLHNQLGLKICREKYMQVRLWVPQMP